MITKNIFKYLAAGLLCCGMTGAFTSCSSEDDPYFTAGEDDAPRILNTDIPEGEKGEPGIIANIERTQNFEFELFVTPVHHTTVTWFIDDEQVAEGLKISVPVMAGDHSLKIVATTTKGKTTSRTCILTVRPGAEDPYPAGEDIHEVLVKQGATAVMHGANMSKVVKVGIDGQICDATYHADGDYIEYTVPNLPDGYYALTLIDTSGVVYGAGSIELNENPEYPAGGEKAIWNGSFNVTWGTPFNALQTELISHVEAGTILRVYVSGNGQAAATTSWWRNLLTGVSEDDEPGGRGDVKVEGEMMLEYTLNETSIKLLNEQNGFFMVGDGYTIQKITIE